MAQVFPGQPVHRDRLLRRRAGRRHRRGSTAAGLSNAAFEARDVADFDSTDAYDVITAFDAIHDQAQPAVVLRNIHRALRPGGTFLMVDIKASSRLEDNSAYRCAAYLYTVSTMHCMSVSLGLDGDGLGTCWGRELATSMLVGRRLYRHGGQRDRIRPDQLLLHRPEVVRVSTDSRSSMPFAEMAYHSSTAMGVRDRRRIETELIFHDGFDLPGFAAFPLLDEPGGRGPRCAATTTATSTLPQASRRLRARDADLAGQPRLGGQLGYSTGRLDAVNRSAVDLAEEVRAGGAAEASPGDQWLHRPAWRRLRPGRPR